MDFKVWLTTAIAVFVLHHFVTTNAQLRSQTGDGINFNEEMLQYYISTSPLEPCPTEMSPCLTLNQFASNKTYHLSNNTSITLILQPGTHHLDSELIVANVSQISVIGEREGNVSIVIIECSEKFTFENVTEVNMRFLVFIGCTENYIQSVEQFILDNCTFNGLGRNGTALNIIETMSVNITSCSFSDTQGSYKQFQYLFNSNQFVAGGAIISANSSISIHDSTFERNIAQLGGAIFAEQESELILTECVFNMNGDSIAFGSAVFANSGSSVTMEYCTFQNISNRQIIVDESGLFSGKNSIVGALESNILIQGCTYRNNVISDGSFLYCLLSNITLIDTIFEHNDAYGYISVSSHAMFSSTLNVLEIVNCTFTGNNINRSFVRSKQMEVKILNCTFENNSNTRINNYNFSPFYFKQSCIVDILESSLVIHGCTYANNSIQNGYIIYGFDSNISLVESVFEHNDAFVLVIPEADINANTPGSTRISRSSFLSNRNEIGTIYAFGIVLCIKQCNFSGNSAQYGAVLFAIDSTTTMSEVNVTNNVAYGSGIILLNSGNLTSYDISIVGNRAGTAVVALGSCTAYFMGNTKYSNNEGSIYAATSIMTLEGNVNVSNNVLFNNRLIPIEEGGAITTLQSSIEVSGTIFLTNNSAENGGAMYILESTFSMNGDITITNNYAGESGGGIYLYQSRLNIQGECSISDNTARKGGGVYAVSSTVTLEDNQRVLDTFTSVTFNSNTAMLGGAFFLSTNTKIYTILVGSFVHRINFRENTAEYGGALYIDDQSNPDLCNGSSSTECFFQLLALSPAELMNVIELQNEALNFTGNSANSTGDAIFGGLLDRCMLNILTPSRSQIYGVNYIQSISNIDNVDLISSHSVRLCFCIANQSDCSYDPPTIYVMKGHTFKISVVAVDQVNHTLESDVEAFLSSNNGLLGEGQKQQSVTTNCTNLMYNIITPHETEELLLNAVGPCGNAHASQRRVKVEFVNCTCPIGFQPAASIQTNCKCECHSNLTNFVSTENCYPSNGTFKPNTNAWINYTNTMTEPNDYYLLVHPRCPYDYCKTEQVTISLSQPNGSNELCDFNRADTLCGACLPGYSVSFGSSRCMKCHGKHWPLVLVGIILLEVIAGIAIVCVLLFLNMTVAMGTINGILFYANIVYGNSSIFFNNLPTPSFPSVFIAWLNLDIGFNVCLYDGIDTFAKTLLQLVFPIYLFILVVAVIIISKYSQRFSNLIGKKDPVATLATLILLSYAKILSTVITILSFTTLQYPEGSRTLWKPDATIEYLKHPKHAILFFVAIIILLLSATYTIILISWQLLVRLPNWKVFASIRNPKLSCFIGAYHAPYTSKHRYWTGLLLTLRVILFLVSAINLTG